MKHLLAQLLSAGDLDEATAYEAFESLLDPQTPEPQKAAFLALTARKTLAQQELSGFRKVLEERAKPVPFSGQGLIDVCGTGGDNRGTFNISTLTAFVVAGDGIKVAKHGNYAASSKCGSSNVLEALGVRLTGEPDLLRRQLDCAGIAVLHAPLFQPLLGPLGPIRRALGFRTVFNILGPLLNPLRPEFQLIGVSDPAVLRLYHRHLSARDHKYALVHSADGCDEVSLTAETTVVTSASWKRLTAEQLGLERVTFSDIAGGDTIEEYAAVFRRVLEGEGTPHQESVVLANAAVAIELVRKESFADCLGRARESLRSGRALHSFKTLAAIS